MSYNRFVELMKQALIPLTVYLKTQCMGLQTGFSFIDSTSIVVCDNHRFNSHKVFSEEAKRGKTSTGWKFGFEHHLIINYLGEILSFCLTTANTDDRKPEPDLIEDLTGWLYGDKGYILEKSVAWLKEKGLNLVTKVGKNIKPKGLKAFDKANDDEDEGEGGIKKWAARNLTAREQRIRESQIWTGGEQVACAVWVIDKDYAPTTSKS